MLVVGVEVIPGCDFFGDGHGGGGKDLFLLGCLLLL